MVGVQCEGKPHFWVDADGAYQEEGQNRVIGNIWNKVLDFPQHNGLLASVNIYKYGFKGL